MGKFFGTPPAKLARQAFMIIIGCAIYSVGQLFFIRQMRIPLGGVTGIALIINHLAPLPVGAMNFVLNIPLLILGYRSLGREFFLKTVFGTVMISLMMDLAGFALPAYRLDNMLLSAVAGGAIMGLGIGIVFRQGGTAGGTDILAKHINKKRDIPVGNFSLYVNVFVIGAGALVYGNLESALYAMITTFISNTTVDRIVYGADVQKQAIIITDNPKDVAGAVMSRLGRGVTALDGRGMFTGSRRTVLMCVVHRYESASLKAILKETDAHSILLLSELNEVFGAGFKNFE